MPPEVVADGGEDGICRISCLSSLVIAIHPMVFFEMSDHGFDG
jgi:hypothetical protein